MTTTTLSAAAGALSKAAATYRDRFLAYLPFKAFLWAKIPLGAFAGLRVRALDARTCEVSVPYGWRTRNPFGSIYFAAHAMAAELSTGALVLLHVANHEGASVSTLVRRMQATYEKAAKSTCVYRCEDGEKIAAAVRRAVETGEPVEVEVSTRGAAGGQAAAEFKITWSMKKRAAAR